MRSAGQPRLRHRFVLSFVLALGGLVASWAATLPFAQEAPQDPTSSTVRGRGRGGGGGGGGGRAGAGYPGTREPRAGVPEWHIDPAFRPEVFTFVRLQFQSYRRGGFLVDYPGADLNFSYRLEQLTSMKVDPDGRVLGIEDPELVDYPFVFMIDPRNIRISEDEAKALRQYLLGGGFLMIDDFWGNRMWDHLMGELEKVFPNRKWVSLGLDHAIFNRPFKLNEKPQVPSEDSAHRQKDSPGLRRTWEDEISWEEPQPADYRAFLDDRGRIMILVCWNTDLSDGWEEEAVSPWFFETYAEKYSFPMGINIVFYALTH